jgi:hypothetical protein
MSPRGSAPERTSGLRLAGTVSSCPPSGRAATAVKVARWWTRVYTAGLPVDLREARRAEVESDLWESVSDGAPSRHILARLALGVVDDLSWSLTLMDTTTRATATWSLGSLLVLVLSWLWLSFAPESLAMRESRWAFPVASALHLLGIVLFVGMRLVLDLRVLGWAFRGTAASEVITRVGPWSLAGAVVTVVSGMALYSADSARLADNGVFQFKIAALAAALVNAWFFHAMLAPRARDWETGGAVPAPAVASAYVSLALWVTLVFAGRFVAFA